MWPYYVEIMIPPSEVSLKSRRQGLGRRLMTELLHRLPGLPGHWRLFPARVGWVPLELWVDARSEGQVVWVGLTTMSHHHEWEGDSEGKPFRAWAPWPWINICAMLLIQKNGPPNSFLESSMSMFNPQISFFYGDCFQMGPTTCQSIAFLTAVIPHIVNQPSLSIGAMRLYNKNLYIFTIFLVGTSFDIFWILNLGASKSRLQFEKKNISLGSAHRNLHEILRPWWIRPTWLQWSFLLQWMRRMSVPGAIRDATDGKI